MHNTILSRDWWSKAGTRAIRTFAQAALSAIPVTAATIGDVNFTIVLSTAALAAVLSLLTSLAGLPEVSTKKEAEDNGY